MAAAVEATPANGGTSAARIDKMKLIAFKLKNEIK